MSSERNRASFRYFCYLGLSRRTRKEREWSPDEGARETPPKGSVVIRIKSDAKIHGSVLQRCELRISITETLKVFIGKIGSFVTYEKKLTAAVYCV
jgi:hypothetical protein